MTRHAVKVFVGIIIIVCLISVLMNIKTIVIRRILINKRLCKLINLFFDINIHNGPSAAGGGCRPPCWRGFLFVLSRPGRGFIFLSLSLYIYIYIFLSRSGRIKVRAVPNRFALSPIASHCPQSVASGSLRLLSERPLPFFYMKAALRQESLQNCK